MPYCMCCSMMIITMHTRHLTNLLYSLIFFLINYFCSDASELFILFLFRYLNANNDGNRSVYLKIMIVIEVFMCRITSICLPFQSKWLYVGSERGNVHIVNIESFTLSGYIINWNKAIDL